MKQNYPIDSGLSKQVSLNENGTQKTQRQLEKTLKTLYSMPLSIEQFFNIIKNRKYKRSIIGRELFWKSYSQLTPQEKRHLDLKLKEYEFFQIYNEDWTPLLNERWLPIVDFRKNCHWVNTHNEWLRNYHRASDFIIINSDNKVLISLRSKDKDTYPGYWELWWWHCDIWEDFQDTLVRELEEEQNIKTWTYDFEKLWKFTFIDNNDEWKQFQHQEIYVVKISDTKSLEFDVDEISDSKWFSLDSIFELMDSKDFKIIPHQKLFLLKLLEKLWYDTKKFNQSVFEIIAKSNIELVNQSWFIW